MTLSADEKKAILAKHGTPELTVSDLIKQLKKIAKADPDAPVEVGIPLGGGRWQYNRAKWVNYGGSIIDDNIVVRID